MNDYSNEFNKLVNECHENGQYVGLGNPKAKILFVGKEAALNPSDESGRLAGSAQSWIGGKESFVRDIPSERAILNGNSTWQKYQKVFDAIKNDPKKRFKEITFLEHVFTTELNGHFPAKTSVEAKSNLAFAAELKRRKEDFFKHDYIQSFPIVVVFAMDNKYIETYNGEVRELFNVVFDDPKQHVGRASIYVHHNKNGNAPKLVLHTWQAAAAVSNAFLAKIGMMILDFANVHDINLFDHPSK